MKTYKIESVSTDSPLYAMGFWWVIVAEFLPTNPPLAAFRLRRDAERHLQILWEDNEL